MTGENSFMNFTSFGVIEKLYNILYKNEQHKWLAYWLISKFDWGSENIYFYVRESLRKMINNKDINHNVIGPPSVPNQACNTKK